MKKNNQTNRYDFNVIESWVHQNSKVLDLGCGDGLLLNHLKDKKISRDLALKRIKIIGCYP